MDFESIEGLSDNDIETFYDNESFGDESDLLAACNCSCFYHLSFGRTTIKQQTKSVITGHIKEPESTVTWRTQWGVSWKQSRIYTGYCEVLDSHARYGGQCLSYCRSVCSGSSSWAHSSSANHFDGSYWNGFCKSQVSERWCHVYASYGTSWSANPCYISGKASSWNKHCVCSR